MNYTGRAIVGCVGLSLLAVASCATDGTASSFNPSPTAQEYARIADAQCTGLPAKEQQMGLFAYRDSIAATRPYKEEYQVGKTRLTHDRGVELAIRAQRSMTAPWLERVATCHIALERSKAIPENAGDPQIVPGATVHVEETYTGFIASIRVPDAEAAAEVERRTAVAMTATTTGHLTAEATTH